MRAALYQDRRPESGVDIQVDLEGLISEVYVGPKAETFVFDAVSALMDKFLIKRPLIHSTLLKHP
jgi:hypothetical protein